MAGLLGDVGKDQLLGRNAARFLWVETPRQRLVWLLRDMVAQLARESLLEHCRARRRGQSGRELLLDWARWDTGRIAADLRGSVAAHPVTQASLARGPDRP